MSRGTLDVERNFALLVAAAVAGERCPQTAPHGPMQSGAVDALVGAGRIKSEVYALNYRVVTILSGEHAGKATAPHPKGLRPYMVNGRHVDRGRHSGWSDRASGTKADISLPAVSFGKGSP